MVGYERELGERGILGILWVEDFHFFVLRALLDLPRSQT
jgi:hypothetical protein